MNSNGTNLRSGSIFVSFCNNIRENVSWELLKLGLTSGYKGTHRTRTRRSLIEHRAETFGREALILWIKSQSSLPKIYFHLFTSAADRIHFTRALHRSFAQNLSAICDASLSRSARCSFPALQKSRWNHRSYAWKEALHGMVFVPARELPGIMWT